MIAGYAQGKQEAQERNDHQARGATASAVQAAVLNEVPSVQETRS
jgi:hypothetical protein